MGSESSKGAKKLDMNAKMVVIGERVTDNAAQVDRPPIFLVKPETTGSYGPPDLGGAAAEGEPAGFFLRFAANVFDTGLVLALVHFATPFLMGFVPALEEIRFEIFGFLGSVVLFLYFWICAATPTGATVGKKLLHMSVKRINGDRVSLIRAFARNVLFYMLLPGTVVALFVKSKRTVHDFIVDTHVVQNAKPSPLIALVLFLAGNASVALFYVLPAAGEAKAKVEKKIAEAKPIPSEAPAAAPAASPPASSPALSAAETWSPEQKAELQKVFRELIIDKGANAANVPEEKKAARAECISRRFSVAYTPKMLEVLKRGDDSKYLETLTPAENAQVESMPRSMIEIGMKCALEVK